jgi:hypothetical protein
MACPMGALKDSNDNRDAPNRYANRVPPLGDSDSAVGNPQDYFFSDLANRKVNQEAKKGNSQSGTQPEEHFLNS